MDRFVTVTRRKDSFQPTATQKRVIDEIKTLIDQKCSVLIFGDPGVGKTFVVKKALEVRCFTVFHSLARVHLR